MFNLECNCSPEYKIATLSLKIASLPKKQNIQNIRNVLTGCKRTTMYTYIQN